VGRTNFEGQKGRPMIEYSDTAVVYAKTAEPIEILFRLRTQVGPGNHVLDGDPDPPLEGAILGGKKSPL